MLKDGKYVKRDVCEVIEKVKALSIDRMVDEDTPSKERNVWNKCRGGQKLSVTEPLLAMRTMDFSIIRGTLRGIRILRSRIELCNAGVNMFALSHVLKLEQF